MASYYNEIDPFCAQWLRELIADGLIAPGDVDERDIREVTPDDVRGYTQCHFFAGIGGWSYALRLAGWDDARPVWTGSCPCQPFSVAGKGKGSADERHLWPDFYRLIRECRPAVIFGEQVKGAIRHGWLDGISADLEAENYAVGAHVLGAHSVGAPHIRQRLYWMAHTSNAVRWPFGVDRQDGCDRPHAGRQETHGVIGACGEVRGMADAECERERRGRLHRPEEGYCANGFRSPDKSFGMRFDDGGMGDTYSPAATRQRQICIPMESEQKAGRSSNADAWSRAKFIGCADGKARRIEPGIQPLSYGFPNRVGTLRGAGNAIVPQIAAEFVKACNL